jgi:hypothetical protein
MVVTHHAARSHRDAVKNGRSVAAGSNFEGIPGLHVLDFVRVQVALFFVGTKKAPGDFR